MKASLCASLIFGTRKRQKWSFSTIYAFGAIASKASSLNIAILGWKQYCDEALTAEDALRVIARLQTEKWWLGKLRKIHDRWREHLPDRHQLRQQKVASPYCSEPCLREWVAKKPTLNTFRRWSWKTGGTGGVPPCSDKGHGQRFQPENRPS